MKLVEVKGFVSSPKTNMATYDDMVKDPEYFQRRKKKKFDIVEMSPDEYIERAVRGFSRFGNYTRSEVLATRSPELIDKYANLMLAGEEFPTLVLDFADEWFSQEGLHRAMAAKKIGLEKVPVMVVQSIKESVLVELTTINELVNIVQVLKRQIRNRFGVEFDTGTHVKDRLFDRDSDITVENILQTFRKLYEQHRNTIQDIIQQCRVLHKNNQTSINNLKERTCKEVVVKDYTHQPGLIVILGVSDRHIKWITAMIKDPSSYGSDKQEFKEKSIILEIR